MGRKPKPVAAERFRCPLVEREWINHYGYKNCICIDIEHGFIRRFVVTLASIHDSQTFPMLLDPKIKITMFGLIPPTQGIALKIC